MLNLPSSCFPARMRVLSRRTDPIHLEEFSLAIPNHTDWEIDRAMVMTITNSQTLPFFDLKLDNQRKLDVKTTQTHNPHLSMVHISGCFLVCVVKRSWLQLPVRFRGWAHRITRAVVLMHHSIWWLGSRGNGLLDGWEEKRERLTFGRCELWRLGWVGWMLWSSMRVRSRWLVGG